ncbi:MAG: response regulator [Propionivibrio sp.]|uniref:Response regulator n=1 Tax=Candidatus Propionivibrio dominans TaxID=2954373 RepID=A0A9D7F9W3_9RHOO|nr:response regulator [Candidatus Propionivibrio dominans]MBL0168046.1 response regulator [Propionivibrio sp.]
MSTNNQEMQILLVEDNAADGELTLDALRNCGLVNTVQWVKDGAEALDVLFRSGANSAAESHRLRLVLLDLRLPRVDGLDVLRALRADQRTRLLPVVVMTSSREESDLVRAYDLGANSYVVKPVESEAFMHAVRELGLYWMLINKLPGDTK